MTLAQLREQRDQLARQANALNAATTVGNRMSAADAAALDALLNQIEQVDAEIARCTRLDGLVALADNPVAAHEHALNLATRDPAAHGGPSPEAQALRMFLSAGLSGLTAEQRAAMNSRVTPDIRSAMSTTSGTEGGYTTAVEYQRTLDAAMRAYGGIRAVATIMSTSNGNQMSFPTADSTSEMGELVGQNTLVAAADTSFGLQNLDVYKFSSKSIAMPFELLQDSFLNIETYVNEILAIRLGRVSAVYSTTGAGASQPYGIVPRATLGKAGITGQTTSIIYDDLVDLEHSVDPAYRNAPGVGFMMHDSTLKSVRKIKDLDGRPIFVPGYEQGNPGGAPDRLLNRPIYISQEMAAMAANAKSMLFGNYKKFIIRDVMDTTLFRMTDSAYTLRGQVGFVAFRRSGSNLIDAGAAVRYYQNSAS